MMYPNIEKYFDSDKFHCENYRARVISFIDSLYKQLSCDMDLHKWCRCKDNRYEDLYNAFIEKVENIITPARQDIHSEEFFMYNFLHNDDFYNIWTNDVLRLLIKMKRGSL